MPQWVPHWTQGATLWCQSGCHWGVCGCLGVALWVPGWVVGVQATGNIFQNRNSASVTRRIWHAGSSLSLMVVVRVACCVAFALSKRGLLIIEH